MRFGTFRAGRLWRRFRRPFGGLLFWALALPGLYGQASAPVTLPAEEEAAQSCRRQIEALEAAFANPKKRGDTLSRAELLEASARRFPGLIQRLRLLEGRALLARGQAPDVPAAMARLREAGDAKAPDARVASEALLLIADHEMADPATWQSGRAAAEGALRRATQSSAAPQSPETAALRHLVTRARRTLAFYETLDGRTAEAIRLLEMAQVEDAAYLRGARVTASEREEAARAARLCDSLKLQRDFPPWQGALPPLRLGERKRLADLYFAMGDWARAVPLYTALQEEARQRSAYQLQSWCLLQRARALAAQNRPETCKEAIGIYQSFLSHDSLRAAPVAPAALLRGGVFCAGPMRDVPSARSFFQATTARHPSSPEAETAAYYIAVLDLEAKQWSLAEQGFSQFLKTRPASGLCPYIRGTLLPRAQARGKTPPNAPGPAVH